VVAASVKKDAVIVIIATKTQWFQNIWQAVSRAMVVAWQAVTRAIAVAWNATVGAIVSAWNATYRAVAGVFRAIQSAAMAVWGWIKGNWPLLLGVLTGPFGLAVALIIRYWSQISGFFSGLVGTIAGIFGRVVSAITDPFIRAFEIVKGAVSAAVGWIEQRISGLMSVVNGAINTAKSVYNAFAHAWNSIPTFHIPEVDTHIPGIGKVGGGSIGLPQIPTLALGGLMTRSGLVFAHAGEVISPAPARARAGPLVQIMTANFGEKVDVATFGRRLAWEVESAGV